MNAIDTFSAIKYHVDLPAYVALDVVGLLNFKVFRMRNSHQLLRLLYIRVVAGRGLLESDLSVWRPPREIWRRWIGYENASIGELMLSLIVNMHKMH